MKLNIFGWNVLKKFFPKLSFQKKEIQEILVKILSPLNISELNIIFISKKEIQELNKKYRKKDSPTDVLSFVIEKDPLFGEIYISPEFVSQEYEEEEILRDITHGVLHILNYDHKGKFQDNRNQEEEMFVKQENILENILYEINNRTRQSRKRISKYKA